MPYKRMHVAYRSVAYNSPRAPSQPMGLVIDREGIVPR